MLSGLSLVVGLYETSSYISFQGEQMSRNLS